MSTRNPAILVADDDPAVCQVLIEELALLGYDDVRSAGSAEAALRTIRTSTIDCAIVDINFTPGGREGLRLVKEIVECSPATFVVVLSVVDEPDVIVQAIRGGAADYLTKEYGGAEWPSELRRIFRHCTAKIHQRHLMGLRRRALEDPAAVLIGNSENIRTIRSEVARAHRAGVDRFLIVGPTGTGKRAVADYIYATDFARHEKVEWLDFNCGGTSPEMARSELFGIAPNAGLPDVGKAGRPGVFALAKGGYVFLDDFQELPESLHGAFLQVLDTSEVKPVGGSRSEAVRFKLIVATQIPLDALPAQLRRRLQTRSVTLTLKPLAERLEDIEPLVLHFCTEPSGTPPRASRIQRVETEVVAALTHGDFEGNVGDLRNIVWQLAALESSNVLTMDTFRRWTARHGQGHEHRDARPPASGLAQEEAAILRRALDTHEGNVDAAARKLAIDPQSLRRRAAKLGVPVGRAWQRTQDQRRERPE